MRFSYLEFCGFLAAKGCVVEGCYEEPNLHHCRFLVSPKTGMRLGRRKGLNEIAMLPLCREHHQGKEGVHSKREEVWFEEKGIDALRLWASWLAEYLKEGGE